MEKFKNFLKNKKVDKHFKHSGPGARLSDSPSTNAPSVVSGAAQGGAVDRVAASDVAAQAALKRLYKNEPQVSSSQKRIQMIAQRELEEERRKQDPEYAIKQLGLEPMRETDVKEFEHSSAISGVFYTCELIGEDLMLPKPDLLKAIGDYLMEQCRDSEDSTIPAVLLLYSLNGSAAKNAAIEIIGKYLQNILENPSEAKYRRIRLANKAYQERVAVCKGSREFLLAAGFVEERQPLKEGDPEEDFLVMPAHVADDAGRLVMALETLREGQSVPIKVARNASIYLLAENQKVTVPKVTADFFDLTADEVKREQQMKTEEVNRILSLRTKEMRERDDKLRQYKYKYTLVRVRLPDRFVIEGTFGCYEPLNAVREFVSSFLSDTVSGSSWALKDPMNGSRDYKDNASLAELGLAPAVVLHLDFDETVSGSILADEHRERAVAFSA